MQLLRKQKEQLSEIEKADTEMKEQQRVVRTLIITTQSSHETFELWINIFERTSNTFAVEIVLQKIVIQIEERMRIKMEEHTEMERISEKWKQAKEQEDMAFSMRRDQEERARREQEEWDQQMALLKEQEVLMFHDQINDNCVEYAVYAHVG